MIVPSWPTLPPSLTTNNTKKERKKKKNCSNEIFSMFVVFSCQESKRKEQNLEGFFFFWKNYFSFEFIISYIYIYILHEFIAR